MTEFVSIQAKVKNCFKFEIVVVSSISVKPIESYTEEEKDVIPSKSFQPHIVAKKLPANGDHSKTEHHVRSKPQAFSADKVKKVYACVCLMC